MAGPRTLARMFPSGLASAADERSFGIEAILAEKDWTKRTPELRADDVWLAAEAQLIEARVHPLPAMQLDDNLGGPLGGLVVKEWKVHLLKQPFLRSVPNRTELADVSGTVYHEARHAEQMHKMARMLSAKVERRSKDESVGRARAVAAIEAQMKLPDPVAQDAADHPLESGTPEFVVAEGQFDSEFGAGKAEFRRIEAVATARKKALDEAEAEDKAHPSAATKKKVARAKKEFEAAADAYTNLPAESDAYGTEDEMEALFPR